MPKQYNLDYHTYTNNKRSLKMLDFKEILRYRIFQSILNKNISFFYFRQRYAELILKTIAYSLYCQIIE